MRGGPSRGLPGCASPLLLTRIVALHIAGRSAEEIATRVLATEPNNAVFRAAIMIAKVLHDAHCGIEERVL